MQSYDVTLTFTEPLLGTAPLNKEIYREYIASKAQTQVNDELESLDVDAEIEKGTTGFHRVDGQPILYDYVPLGFFKDACGMLARDSESASSKLKAYKKVIDGLIFVEPRRIPIVLSGEIEFLERPLRAQTAQGERVTLARSEAIPVGSSIAFQVLTLGSVAESLLREWFTYGALRGLGCWRNASYGRFTYTMTKR